MILVVIPTIDGREEYLDRCVQAYNERTADDVAITVVENEETCGIAWELGATALYEADYLHFTADDIVPGDTWDIPFREAVDQGKIPCGLVIAPTAESLDPVTQMPLQGDTWAQANFFETPGGEEEWADWSEVHGENEYPSVPFCSAAQWKRMEPMIAGHYGTDKWFGHRARLAGYPVVVRHGARFWHYAAQAGRVPRYHGWTHLDLLDFDLNVAYPMYRGGQLEPTTLHPERGTAAGRELSRTWRRNNCPAPYPWDDPELGDEYR